MKVHKYIVLVHDETCDFIHGGGRKQVRLYIPRHGIIAYKEKDRIDFFSNHGETINEAEEIVGNKARGYVGEVELPDREVMAVVTLGKALNEADDAFQEIAKKLVDLVQ